MTAFKTDCPIRVPVPYWIVDSNFQLAALNPSFEEFLNITPPTTFVQTDDSNIVGWETDAPDNKIEVWASMFQNVPSYDGDFHIEMNSSTSARLFQKLAVPSAQGMISWQAAHRARGGATTINNAEVIIAQDGVDEVVQVMSSGAADWTIYTGTLIKECGVTEIEIAFNSLDAGGFGNFLDDVRLEYQTFTGGCNLGYSDRCGNIYDADDNKLDPATYTLCNPTCVTPEISELIPEYTEGTLLATHVAGGVSTEIYAPELKCDVDVQTLVTPDWEPILSSSQILADGQTTSTITNTGTKLEFSGGNIRYGLNSIMTVSFDFPVNVRLSNTTALSTGLIGPVSTNGGNWVYDNSNADVNVTGQTFDMPVQINSTQFGVITSDNVTELTLGGGALESYFFEVMPLQPSYATTTETQSICEIVGNNNDRLNDLETAVDSDTNISDVTTTIAGNVITTSVTEDGVTLSDTVDLTAALSGLAHTAITNIDLKPTGNPNEYTVEIQWTDENGVSQVTTDPTPVTITPTSVLVTDTVAGNQIATVTVDGVPTVINETVTDLQALRAYDNVTGELVQFSLVHFKEDGTTDQIDLTELINVEPTLTTTTTPVYEYRDIWAEESAGTATNSSQWSFGNGATGFIGLPIDTGWEVEAMYFHADSGGAAGESVSVNLVDMTTPSVAAPIIATITVTAAGDGVDDNAYIYQAIATPIAVPDNAVLGFRTGTEVGTYSDARVGARLRRKVADVVTDVQLN